MGCWRRTRVTGDWWRPGWGSSPAPVPRMQPWEKRPREGFRALAIATVGLSNRMAAGRAPIARWTASTINTMVLVEGDPEPAALVNLALTVTEVKVLALIDAGIVDAAGSPVSGTSTDAVIVAATGRGPKARFGGPVSALGWTVARAARRALDDGIRRWRERNP